MRFALTIAYCLPALAQSGDSTEFFESRIRPVLVARCEPCHSASPKANFRVTSRQSLLQGGDSGPAIVPGKPEESRLYQAITYQRTDLQMPPGGKLPDTVIADVREWIATGAADPRVEAVARPVAKQIDWDRARKF